MKDFKIMVNGKHLLTIDANNETEATKKAESTKEFASSVVKEIESGNGVKVEARLIKLGYKPHEITHFDD